MKKIFFIAIFSFLFSKIIICQTTQTNKYQEFALFVSGKEMPQSLQEKIKDTSFWISYKNKIDEDWPALDTGRIKQMTEWRITEIVPFVNDSLPVFYPFSGPDFLHCNTFFPNSSKYYFFAQEMLGNIPDFTKMSEKAIADYLDKFYYSIRDIYMRSYFITARMNTDLHNEKISGVLPVLLFFIAKTNHEIIDVRYEYVDTQASINPLSKVTGQFSATECVTIAFKDTDSDKLKILRYFRCDLSDAGFTKTPGFKKYLEDINERNTYIKSASYLLHYETFSTIRNIILKHSMAILQDDTGIPYKYFDKSKWDIKLYGVYLKPISDFPNPYLFQKDMKQAYDNAEVKDLPFSIGYHWRTGEQNQMLILRKKDQKITLYP